MEKAGISEKKIKVIPNGIDLGQVIEKLKNIEKREHQGIIIGSIGNLRKAKGYDILIEAASKALKIRKDLTFIILGKGPLEPWLKSEISRLRMSENFKLCSFVEDVYNYLVDFDIFVVPSLWEGFPVVALEAMICGKPIIATSVGDLPDIVKHNITGLIVEPGNPDQLAESILKLAGDKNMRDELGTNALKEVKKFSLENMVEQYIEVYSGFLKMKPENKSRHLNKHEDRQ